MPALAKTYLNCTVYMYPSLEAAADGERVGGSGFLVGFVSPDHQSVYLYVVTNAHVIDGGNHVVRVGLKTGGVTVNDVIVRTQVTRVPARDRHARQRVAQGHAQRGLGLDSLSMLTDRPSS